MSLNFRRAASMTEFGIPTFKAALKTFWTSDGRPWMLDSGLSFLNTGSMPSGVPFVAAISWKADFLWGKIFFWSASRCNFFVLLSFSIC